MDKEYFAAARHVGELIAQGGHTLIFGSCETGLMGACAAACHEAGGRVIGITPKMFLEADESYSGCDELIITDTLSQRKTRMLEMSDGIVVLPGGVGTYDEFFEIIALKQLGLYTTPVAVLNTLGYYDTLNTFMLETAEKKFMGKSGLDMYAVFKDPDIVVEYVCSKKPEADSLPKRSIYDYMK